jgi:uncharacterized membrane protein YgdD (TMEM256/DUF423 family)
MNWTATGAVMMALGVMIGAFGAHGLQGRIDAHAMEIYQRAVLYHFIHSIGILIVAGLSGAGLVARGSANWVCWLLLAGVVLFSGSLYALVLSGAQILGAITPIGGVSFIAAWVVLAVSALRQRPTL